ncbi:MAG: sulfatase-like hydrolase/transferase [Pontixanthobacter sp.]
MREHKLSFETLKQSTITRELPLRWLLLWLLLPHFPVVIMLPFGGPPMSWALIFTIPTVLLAAQLPWRPVKALLLLSITIAFGTIYVSTMFNLGVSHLTMLPSIFDDIRPLRSPEYIIGSLVALCAIYAAMRLAPRVERFPSLMSWMMAVFFAISFLSLEFYANAQTRGSYKGSPGPGDEVMSATDAVGLFDPITDAGKQRHLVIIIVEALGLPRSAEETKMFARDWNRSEWAERYDVQTGSVPYYGSTTNAELRELCDSWGMYYTFAFENARCLPEIYQEAGYDTFAIHGFDGDFFERRKWYPELGFSQMQFRRELDEVGVSRCGGMFAGACDPEIPARIATRLKSSEKPQLAYWLTLNGHVPVVREPRMGTDRCDIGEPGWRADNPHLCRLFTVHRQLADAIDTMAMDPDLPPTDILIVGDHVPPFFDRVTRMKFDGGEVPWVYLRHAEADAGK